MAHTKRREYRQSDEMYDLIGRMADQLGTTRTTAIDVAVLAMRDRIVKAGRVPRDLVDLADELGREKRMLGPDASREARGLIGMMDGR